MTDGMTGRLSLPSLFPTEKSCFSSLFLVPKRRSAVFSLLFARAYKISHTHPSPVPVLFIVKEREREEKKQNEREKGKKEEGRKERKRMSSGVGAATKLVS